MSDSGSQQYFRISCRIPEYVYSSPKNFVRSGYTVFRNAQALPLALCGMRLAAVIFPFAGQICIRNYRAFGLFVERLLSSTTPMIPTGCPCTMSTPSCIALGD
jgi:hypothetical protein